MKYQSILDILSNGGHIWYAYTKNDLLLVDEKGHVFFHGPCDKYELAEA